MTAKTQAGIWELQLHPANKLILLAIAEGCGEHFRFEEAVGKAQILTGLEGNSVEVRIRFMIKLGLISSISPESDLLTISLPWEAG